MGAGGIRWTLDAPCGGATRAEFTIEDIERLSRRVVIAPVGEWQRRPEIPHEEPRAGSVFVEAPVYRRQAGLWEHQKYFVKLAFEAHLQAPGGARFVLADQVGLGKTIQLAMAAELMALVGDKPVLVLAPKTLVWQWQDELTGENNSDENLTQGGLSTEVIEKGLPLVS